MDPTAHASRAQFPSSSLYGLNLTEYVNIPREIGGLAYERAMNALTHGGLYPEDLAVGALNHIDRAVLSVLEEDRSIRLEATVQVGEPKLEGDVDSVFRLYINPLGRLHIRPIQDELVAYAEEEIPVVLGAVRLNRDQSKTVSMRVAAYRETEARAFHQIKEALDGVVESGQIETVLEAVIDHVEHVESVCFYVGDCFYALIDRYVNLIDDKRNPGYLSRLRDVEYQDWTSDEVLVVAALHALFTSGRSVRFEEFNGALLSASALLKRLSELATAYEMAGNEVSVGETLGLFARAEAIRQQTLRAPGKSWLRYRWIYGLNFQKTEKVLPTACSDEPEDQWWNEFGTLFTELVGATPQTVPSEAVGMSQLAYAAIARDATRGASLVTHEGVSTDDPAGASQGWLEFLMERIVASAVLAVGADYGMSSSLRAPEILNVYDEDVLRTVIHSLTPASFFTCFVGYDLARRVGETEALAIASSVQKRMQFNRWHFIPGNLERPLIFKGRHWYYPPLIPDIAEHSDMHRAAHNRARVKYSIRCPGPDMSRPSLSIANHRYRGFYDVRVVRMEGHAFSTADMLRVRKRTLWLEAVYGAWVAYLCSPGASSLSIHGFQAGCYLDLDPLTSLEAVDA